MVRIAGHLNKATYSDQPGYVAIQRYSPMFTSSHRVVRPQRGFGGAQSPGVEIGQTVSVPRSFVVNDGEAMRTMLEQGMGIGIKSVWNAHESLKSGRLVEVLPDFPLVTKSAIWALYPSGRIVAPKVRAMIDFLLEQFSPVPPWEPLGEMARLNPPPRPL